MDALTRSHNAISWSLMEVLPTRFAVRRGFRVYVARCTLPLLQDRDICKTSHSVSPTEDQNGSKLAAHED